jgi:hypothetical protein
MTALTRGFPPRRGNGKVSHFRGYSASATFKAPCYFPALSLVLLALNEVPMACPLAHFCSKQMDNSQPTQKTSHLTTGLTVRTSLPTELLSMKENQELTRASQEIIDLVFQLRLFCSPVFLSLVPVTSRPRPTCTLNLALRYFLMARPCARWGGGAGRTQKYMYRLVRHLLLSLYADAPS